MGAVLPGCLYCLFDIRVLAPVWLSDRTPGSPSYKFQVVMLEFCVAGAGSYISLPALSLHLLCVWTRAVLLSFGG